MKTISSTKRIGIDCRPLSIRGGVKTYGTNLIQNLLEIDTNNQYVLFYNDKKLKGSFQKDNCMEICIPFNIPFLYFVWDQVIIPFLCRKYRIDIIHGIKNSVPIFGKTKKVATVQDLIPVLFPSTMKLWHSLYWRLVFYFDSKIKAFLIFTSDSTKNDFLKLYPTRNNMRLVPLASATTNISHAADYDVRENMILYVGSLEPRKNIPNLIKAFYIFLREFPNYKLYLVGKTGWEDPQIDQLILQLDLSESVIKMGFVEKNILEDLYKKAKLFVYVSIYEGFGLPVLEAMSYALPVITSNTSSLKEIGEGAACLVSPDNSSDIAEAIREIVTDPSLEQKMIINGLNRAKDFSWKKCAEETLEIYKTL